jgi:hypothetical protein
MVLVRKGLQKNKHIKKGLNNRKVEILVGYKSKGLNNKNLTRHDHLSFVMYFPISKRKDSERKSSCLR